MCCSLFLKAWVAVLNGLQIKNSGLGRIRSNSTLLPRHAFIFWHLPYSTANPALVEAPQSESPKPINGQWKERGNFKWQAPQHLISIAELSLCVPLSHWYFEEMHGTVTRAPRSNTHDVIEVVSLQAADDPVLGRVSSHACFGKLHFGGNNAKRLPAETCVEWRRVKGKTGDAERNGAEFLSCYDLFHSICLRVFSVL